MTDAPTCTTAATPVARTDPRADVLAAQRWVASLVDAVVPDQLDLPTPDADWDVRMLLRHLVGVADRLVAMGHGRPAGSVAALPELPGSLEEIRTVLADRIAAGERAWADDASLYRVVAAPFGDVPGQVVLTVYLSENLVHGWDLAVATGQDPEGDPRLAGVALAAMQRVLPATDRAEVPFDDAVEPAPDAGPTQRLAAWLGRPSPVG